MICTISSYSAKQANWLKNLTGETLRRVGEITLAVEKQRVLRILSVCL